MQDPLLSDFISKKHSIETQFSSLSHEDLLDSGINDLAEYWECFRDITEDSTIKELFLKEAVLMLMERNSILKDQIYNVISLQ